MFDPDERTVGNCEDGPDGVRRTLRIGASLPFSGFMRIEGVEMYLGMEFWRQRINERGGLLGRPVEFVIYDDRSIAKGAKAAYRTLLEDDDVDLVMGTAGTLATRGTIEVLEAKGMPCVFAMSWGPRAWDKDREWTVPLLPIAGQVPKGLVEVLANVGMESFAIVRSSSGYVTDLTAGLKRFLKQASIDIRTDRIYPRGQADERRAALRDVAKANADVIGGGGSVDEVKPLIRAVRDMGIEAKTFAWFDFDDTRLFPVASAAEGMLGPGLWSARADWAGNREFVREYYDWAKTRRPDWSNVRLFQHHSPAAYAGATLLQRAVENAGEIDPTAVRDELWGLDTETICGKFEVDDEGYQVGKRMLVLQYQRHAREIVWPESLRTAKARIPTLTRPGT
ncbi:MAG: ABC transporter substrate-binding protein [Halanaeroarchaeum sp.]